jgi:hypothetical protein
MAQSEDTVDAIVKRFEVTNSSTIGLVGDLSERLIGGQQLVNHVPKVGLLLYKASIHIVIATGGVGHRWIERGPKSVVPVLEFELTLSDN